MNKPQYKLDQLVKYTVPGGSAYGEIQGVTHTKDGVKYEIDSSNEAVNESDVIQSYRVNAKRGAKKNQAAKPGKKVGKTTATKSAGQDQQGQVAA